MDLPSVPDSVSVLVSSGKLPPVLAPLFDGDPHWSAIASAVDEHLAEFDDAVRGVVALAGAYGHLDTMEYLDSKEMTAHNDRAEALLSVADGFSLDTDDLWTYSHRMRDVAHLAADDEEYIAKHGALPAQRLNVVLEQAHALYEAGDRAAALPLFREVAEADLWGEFSGAGDRADIGWCRLLHDAAHHLGPEATRQIWREAVASRHAARFPWTGWSCRLIEMLLGTGVPDILLVLVTERLEAAEEDQPAGRLTWPLEPGDREILGSALDEIERSR